MSRENKTSAGEKHDKGMPYCETPSVEPFYGQPESCFDLVNMYGTYEIQRTADTENTYPQIAQGLPTSLKDVGITKDDLNRMPGRFNDEEQD